MSRLPIAATEHDHSAGRSRLTPTDEDDFVHSARPAGPPASGDHVHLIRACGHTPPVGDRTQGVGLGGLLPLSPTGVFGAPPLSASDFTDCRKGGPSIPEPHLAPRVWFIRDKSPLSLAIRVLLLRVIVRLLPPQTSVFAIQNTSRPSRPTLDSSTVVPTRTRGKVAAAAGVPQPPVDYGFDLPADPSSSPPPSASSSSRPSVSQNSPASSSGSPPASLGPTLPPSPVLVSAPLLVPVMTPPAAASSRSLLGPAPSSSFAPTRPDPSLSVAERDFRVSVEQYSHADWAREQHNNEPECHAAIRYLQMGQPKIFPSDFIFQDVPKARRTPFSEIRELAHKGRLYTGDDRAVLLAAIFFRARAVAPRASSITNRFAFTFPC